MKKIIPKYAYIPLLTILIMNFITYNGTKIISNKLAHYSLYNFIDDKIPFLPVFIIFYILAYAQWIIGYIIISRENEKICYKLLSADFIAKSICFICFIILPTTIIRPNINSNDIFSFLTEIVYKLDEPVNLFPSIHCLESWLVFRGAIYLHKPPKYYKYIMLVITIFVCASTVLVKQHVFIDIIGGIMVAEVGIFLANKFNIGKFLERINQKLKVEKV